ncbi:MAG TPA: hypothetical protein PJ997_00615 [Candidatus Paceibacterota bacterium]|nr:hypothetical protein [Candidatus Paceibacterota bacterium]HMP18828.1 hypothetical protein [Candidatus Paceibacterota bacterium]HMP85556.1 hypothetical protein [Candidatus Paceibacterota bacterium]
MLQQVFYRITVLSGYVALFIIAIALVVFLYGLVIYLTNSDSEEKRKESLRYIAAGIIGLFVMVSFWGIVSMVSGTFGFSFGIPIIRL